MQLSHTAERSSCPTAHATVSWSCPTPLSDLADQRSCLTRCWKSESSTTVDSSLLLVLCTSNLVSLCYLHKVVVVDNTNSCRQCPTVYISSYIKHSILKHFVPRHFSLSAIFPSVMNSKGFTRQLFGEFNKVLFPKKVLQWLIFLRNRMVRTK